MRRLANRPTEGYIVAMKLSAAVRYASAATTNRVDDLPVVISHDDCSRRSVDLNHALRRIIVDDNTPTSVFITAPAFVSTIEFFSLGFCCRFSPLSWRTSSLVFALKTLKSKVAAGVNEAGTQRDRLLHKALEVCVTDFLRIVWAQELPIIHCRVYNNSSNRSSGQKYGCSEILEDFTRSHSQLRKAILAKTIDGNELRSRRKAVPCCEDDSATTRRPATPAAERRPGERPDHASWTPRWNSEGTASMISCQSFTIGEQAVPMIDSIAMERRIR